MGVINHSISKWWYSNGTFWLDLEKVRFKFIQYVCQRYSQSIKGTFTFWNYASLLLDFYLAHNHLLLKIQLQKNEDDCRVRVAQANDGFNRQLDHVQEKRAIYFTRHLPMLIKVRFRVVGVRCG